MICFSATILLAAKCLLVSAGVLPVTVTTCEDSGVHHLSCDIGVISVQTALYGRADNVTCSEGQSQQKISNTQCSLDGVLDVIKERCDKKRVCELTAAVLVSDPCKDTFKYLQTTYTCQLQIIRHVICEHSLAHLQCAEGQVISVFSAYYGRQDQTTCSYQQIAPAIQNTKCSNPTAKVAESCNGKNSCTVKASNSVFGDPCITTYKYLELAYNCGYPVTHEEETV